MSRITVDDIDIGVVKESNYDLAIFASGYEDRCTYVSKQLNKSLFKSVIIFEFSHTDGLERQRNNRKILIEKMGVTPFPVDGDNEEHDIYAALRQTLPTSTNKLQIFIDFSSMTRSWYTIILNYFRFREEVEEVIFDFIYSGGDYGNYYVPRIIQEASCLPGCEGGTIRSSSTVALLGLGFESQAPYYALDKLEPDEVIAFAATGDKLKRTLEENCEILDEFLQGEQSVIGLPVGSVRTVYQSIIEIISPYLGRTTVTIIPFGPKPHVLASVLIGMNFQEISCFYVKGRSSHSNNVTANGLLSCCRVNINKLESLPK